MTETNGDPKHNHSSIRYIPCEVEPGMFRGEWLVHLSARTPQDPGRPVRVQLLADQRDVSQLQGIPSRRQPVPGWLRVELADHKAGFAVVVLPQPAEPIGETILIDEQFVKQEAGA